MITVARSGSGSAPMRAEHNATRASALRASTHQPSSSPGMTGSCSARRSNALATTAPWAGGSSANSPNLDDSAEVPPGQGPGLLGLLGLLEGPTGQVPLVP